MWLRDRIQILCNIFCNGFVKKLYGRIWRCILPELSVYIFTQMWLVLKQFPKLLIADACIKKIELFDFRNMTKTFVQMYCLYSPLFSLGLGWKEDAPSIISKPWQSGGLEYLRKTTWKQAFILQEYTFIPFKQFDKPLALEGSENQ